MTTKQTYEKALELLKENSTENGFFASIIVKSNYARIWSRDGVVQGLASLTSENKDLIKIFKRNLITLKKFQDKTGRIPSNINVNKNIISYGTLVGKVDATLWYILGVGQYYKHTKDNKFLNEFKDSIKKAIFYLECLELNEKGLLYIPTGGDWADEYITHGYILFDQLLYLQALKEYESLRKILKKDTKKITKKIKQLRKKILINYFPNLNKKNEDLIYNPGLYLKIAREFKEKYALIYFSSDGFANYLDCFANSLLLLMDLPSKKQKNDIMKILNNQLSKQKLKILPAFWPPINSKNPFWKVLRMNSLFGFRNHPHKYHNGGLWPLIQGFYIASLVKQNKKSLAKKYLEKLSKILEKNKYNFNEYYNSKTYEPEGIERIGFSAAGYIIAYNSLIKNKKIFK